MRTKKSLKPISGKGKLGLMIFREVQNMAACCLAELSFLRCQRTLHGIKVKLQ